VCNKLSVSKMHGATMKLKIGWVLLSVTF